ncbi:MAG: hypothetical protein HOV78_11370 [Hamadaea sp.]|nr:hypothetical protein [Hamadaea sp.]
MITQSVVLVDDDVLMARTAVRKYLTKLRNNYRAALRNGGREHYAGTHLRRFDDYLDLYERLGGDPDDIADPEITSHTTTHGPGEGPR